ncbi:MAG: AAA family ATPase [Hyphomicrobiales bacterium]|nr:AAA family ATPase [Hyphomicrobiales bacterium]
MITVADWLKSLGMSEYAQRFSENRIDFSTLPDLTEQDLEQLGIALGDRRKLLRAIAGPRLDAPLTGAQIPPAEERIGRRTMERRHLTVLFGDLVGSTALSTRLDPEELHEIIEKYRRSCTAEIVRSGGFVAEYVGDGVVAYFGYPRAHEDDAERAVRAGLALKDAVSKHHDDTGKPLRVRVGIATGLVLVGDLIGGGVAREHDVVGETPNLAARLQAIAEPNGVIISGDTRRLIGELFELNAIAAQSLKGFAAPVQAWEVVGPSAVVSRFKALRTANAQLVGREEETDLMMRLWQQARAGDGNVVLISGEPGIGKSRVVQTLLDGLGDEPHIRMRYFCAPNRQGSALYPVITHIERAAGFKRGDTAEQRLDKLEAVLARATDDVGGVAPLFAELLSIPTGNRYPPLDLSPQKRRERTLQALVAQAEGLARQPLLIVFEDVHWIDPTSLELLNLIVDRAPTRPVMMVITFRPEFVAPWIGRPHVTLVSLDRLPHQRRAEMIANLTSDKALPKATVDEIIDRTDGIPLFIEELTKVLVERGDAGASTHEIPATLHDMLMARLDRLEGAREVAQIASAIGNEFSWRLLREVAPIEEETLRVELKKLADSELLFEDGSAPSARYRFKHALIRDAAYQSLVRNKRQQFHRQIAQALKERFSEVVEAQPEVLAHHYTAADLKDAAIPYWKLAGEKSMRRSANLEAIAHFETAQELLKTLPETPERFQQELALHLAQGTPLIATRGFASPDVARVYGRARELCQMAGEAPPLFPVLWALWSFYTARAEHKTARELAEQCLRMADGANSSDLRMLAHHALGVTMLALGQFAAALQHLEDVIAIYDPTRHASMAFGYGQDSGVVCRSHAAWALWFLGYPDQARKRNDEALALARQLSHPYSLVIALDFSAWLYQLLQDQQVAQKDAAEALALSTEQQFVFWLLMGMILHGWALTAGNQVDNGIAQMRQGVAGYQATGAQIMLPYYLGLLAHALGSVEQGPEALRLVDEAHVAVQSSGECWWEAELHRLKGELLLGQQVPQGAASDREKVAEEYFNKALSVASSQGAKSLELRAAMSLSRLRRRQGKSAEARQTLAGVYGWFTEGFEVADLRDARALLDV